MQGDSKSSRRCRSSALSFGPKLPTLKGIDVNLSHGTLPQTTRSIANATTADPSKNQIPFLAAHLRITVKGVSRSGYKFAPSPNRHKVGLAIVQIRQSQYDNGAFPRGWTK